MNDKRLRDKYDCFIFDMDGVLYLDDEPIQGARELIQYLSDHSKPYVFLTNNSTLSIRQYVKRLKNMRIPVRMEQIISSSLAAVQYLDEKYPQGNKKVFILGARFLKDCLQSEGFEILGLEDGHKADIVVVGLYGKVTYDHFKEATIAIRRGADFIATNRDKTFPGKSEIVPGAGSLVAFLEASTDKSAIVMGKPEPYMLNFALQYLSKKRLDLSFEELLKRTLVVGDRVDTDILMANKSNMDSVLVLTGVTGRENIDIGVKPTYVVEGVWDI
ncbi:MAG: HAD-IIA family hydrolase [Actinobacteria bacterium]|nr:HAD-IIA family hydrolase [Actinomycetota bacterium]